MHWYYYVAFAVAAIVVLVLVNLRAKREARARIKRKIENQWGNFSEREYREGEYSRIPFFSDYLDEHPQLKELLDPDAVGSLIDNITWNDLNMDDIFRMMNTTDSSAGEEVLYYMLRHPFQKKEVFRKRNELLESLANSQETVLKLKEIFYALGRTKSISFCEFVTRLEDMGRLSNRKSYLCLAFLVVAVLALFINPSVGIGLLIVAIATNIFLYYSQKAEVEAYFINFHYISRLIETAVSLNHSFKESGLAAQSEQGAALSERISHISHALKPLVGSDRYLDKTNVGDSLSGAILDYVKMMTHLDLISFKKMAIKAVAAKDDILMLFYYLGYIESCIAVASLRQALYFYCVPEFAQATGNGVEVAEIYHPLLHQPICNSISANGCVLLTGSNASGKSTFLKTVAMNAILAQTICTVTATAYKAPFYHIYSSMALRDDICSGESYFIVEIKSLKRVLDNIDAGKHVLCFVDEVLRGTNTVERIAASKEILKGIAAKGACCFAATHDIELTKLLDEKYDNYHFSEQIADGQVVFDYVLHEGPATTRNAIKLLKSMNYPQDLVENAENSARIFLKEGQWT